jgi:aspartate aminotransferase
MTGWRVGYAAGPRELISGMARVQSHSTSHAASMAQWASLRALALDPRQLAERVRELAQRRDEMLGWLQQLGMSCVRPDGAFYLFPNVSEYFTDTGPGGPLRGGEAICRYLLQQARVAAVPGEAFGAPRHIRFSFALSLDDIRTGMERVAQALASLRALRG